MDKVNPYELFKPLGIPVGHMVNPSPDKIPFLVFFNAGADTFSADDSVYYSSDSWVLELYSNKYDPELVSSVETVLKEAGICWERGQEVYISDERLFMTPFYF